MTTEKITELIQSICAAHERGITLIKQNIVPEIDLIISTKQKDSNNIEKILDTLLDYAFNEEILMLFKKLCRYYYNINPNATAYYVYSYKELWDNEEKPKDPDHD